MTKARVRQARDDEQGLRRHRNGSGFRYIDPDGQPVRDQATLNRIRSLAIPPAWRDVWIAPDAAAHIQATGYDSDGRKQYIYHSEWSKVQEAGKFDRVQEFGRALPDLRAALQADLVRPGTDRDKVVAAVVRVLETSFTRVGSERYAKENGSYGISTLRKEHVEADSGWDVRLRFEGKGGQESTVQVTDKEVAAVVRDVEELPGNRLFLYRDGARKVHHVAASDVNRYLKEAMEDGFSAKDFRTWAATTLMVHYLTETGPLSEPAERKKVVRDAVEKVADRLHNTVAVTQNSYIHPAVPAAYLDGSFAKRIESQDVNPEGLWPEEILTLRLLGSYGTP